MSRLKRKHSFPRHAGHPRGNAAVVVIALLVILVGAVYFGFKMVTGMLSSTGDNEVQWQFTSVERKPFQHTVIEQGDIESSSNVEVECTVRSRNSSGVQIIYAR